MHPDDDHPVAVFSLDLPQLRKGVHAVDSAEGPEIDDGQPPAEIAEVQRPGHVEPVQTVREVGGSNGAGIGADGHTPMVRAQPRPAAKYYNSDYTMSASVLGISGGPLEEAQQSVDAQGNPVTGVRGA